MGKGGDPSPRTDDSDDAASTASSSSGGSLFSFEAADDAPPPPPVTEKKDAAAAAAAVPVRVANVPVPAATTPAPAFSPRVGAEPTPAPTPPPPPVASESEEDVDDWEDGDVGGVDGDGTTGVIEVVVPEDAEPEGGGEGAEGGGDGDGDGDASPSGGKDSSKSPQRRRGGGMPSIATARAVARSKRAALRRDLLVAAHAEHCTLLLLALARLRHRAATAHAAHSVAAHAAAAASAPLRAPPRHRHRPADVDWAALPDGVRRVVAAHKAACAAAPGPPLSLASTLQLHGYITRPVLGVGLDLAWNAYFRRVGRFFEAAADAAVLGRPPPASHAVHIRRPKGAGGAPAGSYKVKAGGARGSEDSEGEEEEEEAEDRSKKSSSASPRRGGTKRAAPPPAARGKKGAAKRARREVEASSSSGSSSSDDSSSSSTPPPPSNGKAKAKGKKAAAKKAATKKGGKSKSAEVLSDSSSTTASSDSSSTTSSSSSEDAGKKRPRGKKAAAAAAAAKKKKNVKKKKKEECPMLSVSVDDLLDEENLTGAAAEHAVAAWNPAFLDHTPRNPVEAVIDAHRTERALYTSSAFAVDHAYSEHWWSEVLCPDGHWRPVDAPPHAPSLPYVFAAPARSGPGGGPYFVDATAKYAADFSAALSQRIECVSLPAPPDDEGVWEQMKQIEEGEDGSELSHPEQTWLRRTLALLNGGGCDPSLRVAAGFEEDALRRLRFRKRPPTAHKELVRHNLYCAASLLGKLEVLRQGAEPLARAHQYEIYTRDDVTKLRGREAWRRLGREVRPGERALRRVAAAAGFGGHVDPATGARLKEVFAHWQTAKLRVPVTVSNGRISDAGPRGGAAGSSRTGKDREGTVCIADGPLPDGLAHIRTSTPGVRLPALCSSLKIPYGKALVSFTRSGGFSRPNFNGVVVSNEDAPRLSLALAVVEKEKESVAARKKEGEVVQRWERLTLYLVTRLRLREQYSSSS